MADYRSTLTGTQMDAALLDMAEHNSEAYAVGERNGIAVASDDVTYHNNARYYAQIASSQIVGDASSAVRWDTDQSEVLTDAQKAQARENINAASDSDVVKITSQTLTSAQQEQARVNIAAGGSNPNFLDNPWFRINQRNATSGSAGAYIADRWTLTYGSGGVTASRTADTITIASTTGTSHGDIAQRMEKDLFDYLLGKTVTASVMRSDGSVISKSFTFQSSASSIGVGTDLDGNVIAVRVYQASTYQDVQFWKWNTAGTFRAVKLELGSVSTLANDAPPEYVSELAKCQYYCRVIEGNIYTAVGQAVASTSVRFPMPFVMRVKPSISFSGSIQVYGNGGMLTVSSITVNGKGNTCVELICAVSGATAHSSYLLLPASDAKIILSADL